MWYWAASAPSLLSDTWEWGGTAWKKAATTGAPARGSASAAYDTARGKMVLFGGNDGGYLGDTWEWFGTGWTQVAAAGPSARQAASMVFDSTRGRSFLFGGTDNVRLADTWEYGTFHVFTPSDAINALTVAAGIATVDSDSLKSLDVVRTLPSTPQLDIADAIGILRLVVGMDSIPG